GSGGSAGDENAIHVWDLRSGTVRCTIKAHEYAVTALASSPDGTRLISGSRDNRLKLWNLSNCTSQRDAGHSGWITAVAFTPDGAEVVSASGDATVLTWNVESGKAGRALRGHLDRVESVAVTNDRRLASRGPWMRLSGYGISGVGNRYARSVMTPQ